MIFRLNAPLWPIVIKDTGSTPTYTPHRLTYYNQGTLLAAVDFSGMGSKPDTYVCGFILWEIPEPNKIGFSRIEQNIVPVVNYEGEYVVITAEAA